jgi:hypothetical protein
MRRKCRKKGRRERWDRGKRQEGPESAAGGREEISDTLPAGRKAQERREGEAHLDVDRFIRNLILLLSLLALPKLDPVLQQLLHTRRFRCKRCESVKLLGPLAQVCREGFELLSGHVGGIEVQVVGGGRTLCEDGHGASAGGGEGGRDAGEKEMRRDGEEDGDGGWNGRGVG